MASEIKVDTISEKTSANGVTIDGVNIKDSALATAGSVPLSTIDIDGGTDIGAAIVDADLFIIDDGAGGTNRKTTASRLKTYAGFDVTSITGATALAAQPAETDEIVLSDAGTLKRLDITHIQNTPIFAATMSAAQTNETSNTLTKIEFDTEALDTGGVYDTANYRWTPGVAGWYHINASINFGDYEDDANYAMYYISLKLSGSEVAAATQFNSSDIYHGVFENIQAVNWMGYMSDSNYIEVFAKAYNVAWDVHTASSWFQGFRITGV